MMVLYKNKTILEDLYLQRRLSARQIAEMYSTSHSAITGSLRKFGIPVRSRGESISIRLGSHFDFNKDAKEFIYGELLGDGCVLSRSIYSASFNLASKYLEYVRWLKEQLQQWGLGGEIYKKVHHYRGKEYYTYYYCSKSTPELLLARNLFYPDGIKIIPESLTFVPIILRQWYIGDGTLCHRDKRKDTIILHTCGFDPQYVKMATNKLNKMGFVSTHRPVNNVIGVNAYSVVDFLDYIGPCPIECYSYKWITNNRIGQLAMPLKN